MKSNMGSSPGLKCLISVFTFVLFLTALLPPGAAWAVVGGAAFTTFDATQDGCLDSPNGINCNNYAAKDDVYMSGGPNAAGLGNGYYFFAVLAPGSQNGGFLDDADGNLSDAFGTPGGGDVVANRTFHVTDHQIDEYPSSTCSGDGGHATGTSPNGRFIIQLSPYDDTPNPGGVYILAVCEVGATRPSQCKYDAFRVRQQQPPNTVVACKYYDSPTPDGSYNGQDFPLAGWPMTISPVDGAAEPATQPTDEQGCVEWTNLADGQYTVTEAAPAEPNWFNSDPNSPPTPLVWPTGPSQTVTVAGGESETVDFGNFCLGAGGGRTLGFWSNKNGQATMNDGGTMVPELALLGGLNLREADGSGFDPATYAQFRTWLLNATATNMAYMLSAQLAAMALNVEAGFVSASALVYSVDLGFISISDLMAAANTELDTHGTAMAGDPWRAHQEALKDALDDANNNLNFVQATACPATFTPIIE